MHQEKQLLVVVLFDSEDIILCFTASGTMIIGMTSPAVIIFTLPGINTTSSASLNYFNEALASPRTSKQHIPVVVVERVFKSE